MSAATLTLRSALRASRDMRLALVGAGGKTSAMALLARQFEPPVLLAASTHLGAWQVELADRHFIIENPTQIAAAAQGLSGVNLFTGPLVSDRRLSGLNNASLAALAALADRLGAPLLLEADGSRQRPLKAPGAHEPVIPDWVRQVVVVAGLSGLGQPLSEDRQVVHRPEQFAHLAAMAIDAPIGPQALARMLCHPQGGLKGIPPGARRVVLLNQADDSARQDLAMAMVDPLLKEYDSVIVAALRPVDRPDQPGRVLAACQPVAAVLLAGGSSTRLGQPKALLAWRGKPLIRHGVESALAAGLSPVVVVLGAIDQPIRQALLGLPVHYAINPDWPAGQSTSLRAGLRGGQANTARALGAVVFLLADQPFVSAGLLRALRHQHRRTLSAVIAPYIGDRRTNPVLFDQVTFAALDTLVGDTGGRAIFDRFAPTALPWEDARLLLDIDTPEDYQRLLELDREDER